MLIIGIAITSDRITAVKLISFFGYKRITAIESEKINWHPFCPLPLSQITDALKLIHQRLKLNQRDIALCIPNYCLFTHRLDLSNKKNGKLTAEELNYQLEEHLAIDIEQTEARHCSFTDIKNKFSSLSSAISIDAITPLLTKTEDASINIVSLSGDLFCIANLVTKKIRGNVITLYITESTAAVILISKKKPVFTRYLYHDSYKTTQADQQTIINRLISGLKLTLADINMDSKNLKILLLGDSQYSDVLKDKIGEVLGDKPKFILSKSSILSKKQNVRLNSLTEIAAFAVARVAISSSKFDFNFRSGRLSSFVGRRKLCRHFMVIILLFITLIMVASLRQYNDGNKWFKLKSYYDNQQARIWMHTFPDHAVPSDIPMRLASEKKRLEGLAGKASGIPQYNSALAMFRSVIASMPDYIDISLKDINITQDKVVITGQTKNFTMVEHLTNALDKSGHFQMGPAQSKRATEYIVDFTVTGKVIKHNEPENSFGIYENK